MNIKDCMPTTLTLERPSRASRLTAALARAAMLCCFVSAASAQSSANIRGTVSAFDGRTIAVATREGRTVEVVLPEAMNVSGTKAITLADLKPGMPLGVTTIRRADGQVVAIDIRPIPATARMGLSPFDLQPESTMTNATLEGQVVSAGGAELVLNYSAGTIKVLVPPNTPMSQAVPGTRSDIKPGETIFIAARPDAEGKLIALRVQVSTNGVKPTQ
jgi:Domain of unknown function (DUF5666)